MSNPERSPSNGASPPLALALGVADDDQTDLRRTLEQAGFRWQTTPETALNLELVRDCSPKVLVLGDQVDGASSLQALLQAAGGLADEVRDLAEIEQLERLAQVGRWRFDANTGRLDCTSEGARLLDGAEDLASLLECVEPAQQGALQDWFSPGLESGDVVEFALHAHNGAVRRLRLVHYGTCRMHQASGFVQALANQPTGPDIGAEFHDSRGLQVQSDFVDQVHRGIARANRGKRSLAVLFLHVEQLARATQTWLPADVRALRSILAERLRNALRSSDLFARPEDAGDLASAGDDAFLLAIEVDRDQDAANVARRLLEVTEGRFSVGEHHAQLQLGIGVALHPSDSSSPPRLIELACGAALEAREKGQSGLSFHDAAKNAEVFQKLSLEAHLRRAVELEQFEVFYQPKVNVATDTIVGMEALVRWRHPEMGLVSPLEFIPLAEETGLILPIGETVLRQACMVAKRWQDEGLPPIRMAVNLSSAQFEQPDLYEMVLQVLDETGLAPEWLELELTESMLMGDAEAAVVILRRFKRAGIHISIDDFGTGYSSLSYLRRFPIDSLKIDRSFIRDVNVNADDAAIATSIILMGRSLKLRVVAEGVETKNQLAFLKVMQCDEAQGYLYSRPVPADEARKLLDRN
ncbi:putative bifunctional diguanylate cyclase/phosphodiesterase [Engelhardtia mirabilis]|uniref:Phytochrome-like protein cph2 n=1 Tax=Engelhardtia mirabilis TaxID=2528011 RepID=A0A518BEV5_9BACT|nr:Phytochrome-like protein cph2 [Planctomycetes bacterium Pla133]QDU99837.1 Phytochrome-like protein cph2 [Planctomycetes bacterium Pla86]